MTRESLLHKIYRAYGLKPDDFKKRTTEQILKGLTDEQRIRLGV